MLMNKRWILGLSLLASLFVGVAWLCWPQPRISPASFERIHEGMSQDQIEAIIGLPPGDYYTGPRGIGGITSRGPFGFPCVEKGRPWGKQTGRVIIWWGNDYAIQVSFDKSEKADGWYLLHVVPAVRGSTFIDRVRARLGW
jgi:hypothetical protein